MEPSSPCSKPKRPSPCSTPKESRKSNLCRTKDTKNPYANRGLHKFSALLADLEEKRKKIYTQMDSKDISLVRFVYSSSNSNDVKPIVVKLKDKKQEKINVGNVENQQVNCSKASDKGKHMAKSSEDMNIVEQPRKESEKKREKKSSKLMNMNLDMWTKPCYYLSVFITFILLCLAMFGRAFAILWTSLGWYLVPSIRGGSSNLMRQKKKKEYGRRLSDKRMMVSDQLSRHKVFSPRSVIAGPANDKSPRQ